MVTLTDDELGRQGVYRILDTPHELDATGVLSSVSQMPQSNPPPNSVLFSSLAYPLPNVPGILLIYFLFFGECTSGIPSQGARNKMLKCIGDLQSCNEERQRSLAKFSNVRTQYAQLPSCRAVVSLMGRGARPTPPQLLRAVLIGGAFKNSPNNCAPSFAKVDVSACGALCRIFEEATLLCPCVGLLTWSKSWGPSKAQPVSTDLRQLA